MESEIHCIVLTRVLLRSFFFFFSKFLSTLSLWNSWVPSFIYLSVGFIFILYEATLMVFAAVQEPGDFDSAQNTQLLEGFSARTELFALAGVDSLFLVVQKRDRGKTTCKSSSVAVRHFYSVLVRIRRFRTVSLCFLEIILLSYGLAGNVIRLPEVFSKCPNTLFASVIERGVRDNEKGFVERRRAKETINGRSQMDFTHEIL